MLPQLSSQLRNGLVNGSSKTMTDMKTRSAKMEAFNKLKPTCVALMALAPQTPSSTTRHASLIDTLHSLVIQLDSKTLDAGLINYILFPLTNIIRQHNPLALPDNFLEAAFRLLGYVVGVWKVSQGGMEEVAWEQLWRFVVASLIPRISSGKEKGKGKEVGQEVQFQAVYLLSSLLEPVTADSASRTSRAHPTAEMLSKVSTTRSPLLPTLFQTITLLLDSTLPSPPHLQLQLASLRLLRPLISLYLKGKHNVLAAVLPGTVSNMSKVVHAEGRGMKGEVAQNILGIIEDVVVSTLDDNDLRDFGVLRPIVNDLTQLGEEWERASEPIASDEPPPPSPASTSTSTSTPIDPFPPLSQTYLAFTSTQLLAVIPPILSILSVHTSDLARTACASLSSALVDKCHESLPFLIPRALPCLLILSKDPFDPVRHDSRRRLRALLETDKSQLDSTILDILGNAINSLPRLVTSQQDKKVDEQARLITAIAETTIVTGQNEHSNAIAGLLGPSGAVERWSWALLDCMEFGRPTGWTATSSTAAKIAEKGWQQGSMMAVPLLQNGHAQTSQDGDPIGQFPHLPLRYVESEATTRALSNMLSALGAAGGETALHSVEYFLRFAKANRRGHSQISKAVTAMWVTEKLLDGIAIAQMDGPDGRVSKATRKMAKEVVKVVVAIDDDDADDEYDDVEVDHASKRPEETDTLVPVERSNGINTLTTLLDKKPTSNSQTAAETRRLHASAQRSLLTALSLESLALSSRILSSSFRPLLLSSLYILLAYLAYPQTIINEYASLALSSVAYHTGYASTQNLVLDNVDYVINVVSQRLTYNRLSSTAPLVLIAMIRLVGEEIVPLVHDLVDEIFDALDSYHGYESLASALLAVLVALIEVMENQVRAEGLSEERERKMKEMSRIDKPPKAEDFEDFLKWWRERKERNKENIQEILERAPQHAWGKADLAGDTQGEKKDGGEETPDPNESEEIPATRSQIVATRILDKSLYFLTHQSPLLRSRILSLISRAIPVLARGNRESDLLPLIDKNWGTILNRLDIEKEKVDWVVVEAAEVIERLCEDVGDFMSKRILDNVWPRFKILLDTKRKSDKQNALARRGGVGLGTQDKHSTSHRLYIAILRTARYIAREVPIAEDLLWEIMVILRPFLDKRIHEELQVVAREVFEELGKRDGDALWVLLNATMGRLNEAEAAAGKGVWGWLADEGIDLGDNAEKLLVNM